MRLCSCRPSYLHFVAVLALWAGTAGSVLAQTQPEVRHSFAFIGVPLGEALERLIDETSISLIYEPAHVAGETTFCKAERLTTERLLACVLDGTGFDFVRLSSGTYVLIADPRTEAATGGLAGLVRDAQTGEPLADVSILLASAQTGTATNRDGRFALTDLEPGPQPLLITHLAYHPQVDTVYVEPGTPLRLDLALQPRVLSSDPIVISGMAARLPSETLLAEQQVPSRQLTPTGLGAADVVQNLGTVAGVALGAGLSDVHVQGGDISEQLFRLDGVPVFVPVSNGGFVGPFSPFAVGHVTVRKAGFGAAYGSGLSGVIDIAQRLAPESGPAVALQVDPLSVNGRWNGRARLPKGLRTTWMVAGRQGFWDIHAPGRINNLFRRWAVPDAFLADALADETEEPSISPSEALGFIDMGVRDVHLALHVQDEGLRSLKLGWYRGMNRFGLDENLLDPEEEDLFEAAYSWQNNALHARYEWVQNRRLFLHASGWRASYQLEHPLLPTDMIVFDEEEPDEVGEDEPDDIDIPLATEEFNVMEETGVRFGGDWAAARQHHMTGEVTVTHTDSGIRLALNPQPEALTETEDLEPHTWRVATFLENRWAISHHATLTLGTRLTWLPGSQAAYAEPRLAFQYDRPAGNHGTWAFTAAAGRYRQFLHAFDVATYNVTALLPRVRFWLPLGTNQRPPEAYHATVGALYRLGGTWQFGAEAYYKHQPHLLVLDHTAVNAADALADANGRAYGLTTRLGWTNTKHTFDLHYTLGRAERRIQGRFDDAMLPAPWDAPHRLHATLDVQLRRHWTLSVRGQGIWGRRWGFRQGYYDFLRDQEATPYDLTDPTAHRLPAFLQADLGLAYTRTLGATNIQARLSAINATGRNNVTDWSLDFNESTNQHVTVPRYAVPFMPSFSLRIQR